MKNWVDPEAKAEAERYDNPIPSRTLILEIIEQKQEALSHADLVELFEIVDSLCQCKRLRGCQSGW